MDAIPIVVFNLTKGSVSIRKFPVLTFLRQPIFKRKSEIFEFCRNWWDSARAQGFSLFPFLKVDRTHCEVCAMLRVSGWHHCFQQLYDNSGMM